MKKLNQILVAVMSLAVLSTFAQKSEETVTFDGVFKGANCMFFLKECPDDMPEGHIASEPDFVLTLPDGKYYYIVNLDRAIKERYFHKEVRIIGKVNKKGSIVAEKLQIKKKDKWRTIWSLKREQEERDKQYDYM